MNVPLTPKRFVGYALEQYPPDNTPVVCGDQRLNIRPAPEELAYILSDSGATASAIPCRPVIPVPDEKRGEVPKPFVVVKPGEQAIEPRLFEFCRTRMKYRSEKDIREVFAAPA